MKKRKQKQKKEKKPIQIGALLSRMLFIVGVLSLALFLWFAIQYQTTQEKLAAVKSSIHQQFLINDTATLDYVQILHGDLSRADKLSKSTQEFNQLLTEERSGGVGLPEPDSAILSALDNVSTKWKKMQVSLDEMINGRAVIEQVGLAAKRVSKSSDSLNMLVDEIQASVDPLSDTKKLEETLSKLEINAVRLNNLTQSIVFREGNTSTMAEQFDKQAKNLVQLVTAANYELNSNSSLFFKDDKGLEKAKLLDQQSQVLGKDLLALGGYMPEYLKLGQVVGNIEQQNVLVARALEDLSKQYTVSSNTPISFLPLNYTQLFIVLTLLGGILLILWAWLLIKSNRRSESEALKLTQEAKARNEEEQQAILRLMDELANLSDGDLTIEAEVTEDFTGAIADSINFSVENMRDMVGTIIHTSDELTKATASTQNVSKLLAESSYQQSEQINRSNKTVNSMSVALTDITQNTDASAEIARVSVEIAQDGRERVRRTIKSMSDIRENIQDTAKRIKQLGESSQEIEDIVEIIKGIADQTSILALNAAIQATSAGEAGRGFAVVADEVQRLAERSTDATKRIEVLVQTIQADANEAVSSMENSIQQVVNGANIAEQAGQSLDKIEDVSNNLADLIVNVSNSTRDAAVMAKDVASNMTNLSALNNKSVSDVSSSVESVDNLGALSTLLKESVSGFTLPD